MLVSKKYKNYKLTRQIVPYFKLKTLFYRRLIQIFNILHRRNLGSAIGKAKV